MPFGQEILKMRELTDKPFGVNVAQAFVRDPEIVSFIIDQGVKFVTTSAGNPERYTEQLKSAGLTVFHVVPSLSAALKAVECGVDGLIVEGGEGGGFQEPAGSGVHGVAASGSLQSRCPHHCRLVDFWTAAPWRQPLLWVLRQCKWALAWCLLRNRR
jgi:NAD(P)H-dependent flavin oxidoreductase YrpB (nitropropane dioxygenase family)